MNFVAVCVCVAAVLLMSGTVYSIVTSGSNFRWSNLFVALFIGVGAFGLKSMYDSRHARDPWMMLFVGFLAVFVAYLALEFLFLTGFGR